jgi:hypothetical protein
LLSVPSVQSLVDGAVADRQFAIPSPRGEEMALIHVRIEVEGMPNALEGFIEATSSNEAAEKAITFLNEAPILGKYSIVATGAGAKVRKEGVARG